MRFELRSKPYLNDEPRLKIFGFALSVDLVSVHLKNVCCSMHFFQKFLHSFRVSNVNSITSELDSCWLYKRVEGLKYFSRELKWCLIYLLMQLDKEFFPLEAELSNLSPDKAIHFSEILKNEHSNI